MTNTFGRLQLQLKRWSDDLWSSRPASASEPAEPSTPQLGVRNVTGRSRKVTGRSPETRPRCPTDFPRCPTDFRCLRCPTDVSDVQPTSVGRRRKPLAQADEPKAASWRVFRASWRENRRSQRSLFDIFSEIVHLASSLE